MKLLHIGICAKGFPLSGFQQALASAFGDYREVNAEQPRLHDEVLRVTSGYKPDVVFMQLQREGLVHPKTLGHLKALGSWIANWTGDARRPTPAWYIETGRLVDITLFTNLDDVDDLNRLGIPAGYLQIGFDPKVYCPDGPAAPCQPVVFFANHYPSYFPLSALRHAVATSLRGHFAARFGLYGFGWERADGNLMCQEPQEACYYRGAKIGVSCSNYDLRRYFSDRLLRIMGCGAMCITKWHPELEVDFDIGKDLVVWRTLPELIELCEHYLVHDADRAAIAEHGCRTVHSRFTLSHMAQNLLTLHAGALAIGAAAAPNPAPCLA